MFFRVNQFRYNFLKSSLKDSDVLNCDLDDCKRGFTTVPINCSVTNLIPDLCLFSENDNGKNLLILELTVPFELNIEKAHIRKSNKYAALISDIDSNNINTDFIALEIGSRGYISPENMKSLKKIYESIL